MPAKKQDTPEISSKSTKEQILSAYHEALERLQEKQVHNPQEEKKKLDERVVIDKTAQTSAETIISNLATLKISLTKQIDTLSENLVGEFHKLTDLKQAIAIEQAHLHNLYEINETAHTLSALILTQQEQTDKFTLKMQQTELAFAQEMGEKKALWEKQQAQLEADYAERKEKLKIQREREEEDYKYNLEIKRRQDVQEDTLRKEEFDKELEEKCRELNQKEVDIEARLEELAHLKQKVEQFPQELANATEQTAAAITEKLETQYKFAASLRDKEIEGERNLHLQKIASLESRIKEQESLIAQLTAKTDEAIHQVEAIACRALDTSSQRLPYSVSADKGTERLDK